MRKTVFSCGTFILLMILGCTGSLFAAELDLQRLGVISLDSKPSQIETSANGERIYVLTESGTVRLYTADGQFKGAVEVGPEVTRIIPQGEDRLILQQNQTQQMLLVNLEPVEEISSEGAPTLGDPAAPVAIAVFDDFECPYCARAVPVLKQAQQAHPGQVKLIFKNFPLSRHQHSRAAAMAALAAQRQGKFWQLHDLLFANYNQLDPQKIRELAEQVGLDMARFDQDQKDPELRRRIDADLREGRRVGVRGTPSIYVNGRPLRQGGQNLNELIATELAKLPQAESATP